MIDSKVLSILILRGAQGNGKRLALVAGCALIYFAISTASVAISTASVALAVALTAEQPFLDVWRGNFGWAWITYLAAGSLGAIVFLCFQELRFYFVDIALPIVFLIHYAYRMHLQRIQLLKETAVIMDLTIPGAMGGGEAMAKMLEIDPEATAIVSSAYSEDPVMANFRDYGFSGVLVKPFRLEQMAQVLEEVIVPTPIERDFPRKTVPIVPDSGTRRR